MSGYHIIGILCVLLALGGLAYLLLSGPKTKRADDDADDERESSEDLPSRTAETIPPKLRPPSSQPSLPPHREDGPASAPVPDVERPAPAAKKRDARRAPGSFTASPIKATLVSSGTDEIAKIAERASEKKLDVKIASGPAASSKREPASTPRPSSPDAPAPADATQTAAPAVGGAKTGAAPDARALDTKPLGTKPVDAKLADAKPADAKPADAKPADAKPADAKPADAKPADAKPADAKPADAKPADAKKPGKPPPPPSSRNAIPVAKVTPKTTIVAGSNAPILDASKKKKKDVLADIPKLSIEEDEDVEPTKIGKLARREIQPPVEKHVLDEGADTEPAAITTPLHVVFALAQTDPGRRRKQNEDSYLLLEDEGVFVVADGMGGHRGGQTASSLAVKTISDAFTKKTFEAAAHPELPPAASELARSMQMANAAIQEEARAKTELKGMGTTLVAARFSANRQRLYVGHVGDSRCYRIRDGAMKQMTTDHTMADFGVAGPEGAHLSRAVGVWPTVPIDIIMAAPQLGDTYLICSDGLTKMLTNETIATQILHEENPKAAVNRLVMFANAHGGKDNITVILIRIVATDWKPPS